MRTSTRLRPSSTGASSDVKRDRYRMLETIREYGGEQLADADRENLIGRHWAFYEGFAVEAEAGLRGPDGARRLDRVEHDLPNLRRRTGRALERGQGETTFESRPGSGATGRRAAPRRKAAVGPTRPLTRARSTTVSGPPAASGCAVAPLPGRPRNGRAFLCWKRRGRPTSPGMLDVEAVSSVYPRLGGRRTRGPRWLRRRRARGA